MKYLTHCIQLNTKFCFSFILVVISGCSSLPEKQHNGFDPSTVNGMTFHYQQPAQFSNTLLSEQAIANQVTNNLSEWGYNISINDSDTHGYEVMVKVGKIKQDTTPAGFSFSIGNSDPRALDFQKADVLPITCFLSPKYQPDNSAELKMEVLASDYLNNKQDPGKLSELLVDDLSTVCFNLLSNLKVKTQTHEVSDHQKTPSWIPEIRVETEEVPAKEEKIENNTMVTPVEKIQVTDEKPSKEVSLDKKNTINKKEPRKRVIIYNQGSPVIFKFGHERK